MNTLKRFKKQNMLYWLVHTMKSFITQRQEQSTLGLDFEGAAESAGNSELGIHSASERILSVEAFPEYARFLRDPLLGQLLSLLFQQQENTNCCWRITGELTNDQLNSYIDLVNENISSKSIESTIEFESDPETYVEEEQENNLKLQFVNEKAPSKKKRIISKRTSKAINKIANENAREISVSINGFDTDANSLVFATANANMSLTTPDVDDYSEKEHEKDLEKIVFLPKPKRGTIKDDDEED